jgi:uncharacterized protein
MKAPIHPPELYIKETGTARGRGAFAQRKYAEAEVVEVAPVVVIKGDYDDLPDLLKTYVFNWTSLTGVPSRSAIALGYGSMYNHANPANLRYEADAREGVMRFVAARKIKAGEELTINYNGAGGGPVSEVDDWFESTNIELIPNA